MLRLIKGGGDRQVNTPGSRVGNRSPTPKGRQEAKHQQLIMLGEEDWLRGPQGIMSLAEMLQAAGFEVGRGHSPSTAPNM
eukprot:7612337-Karenia_brevis.AAC.1